MSTQTMRWFILAVITTVGLGASQIASGQVTETGSLNLGATGWNASATLTTNPSPGTFTLELSFANNTVNTVDINSFALELFSGNSTFTLSSETLTLNGTGTALTNWNFFADSKSNNGNASPFCTTSTINGWLCGDRVVTGTPTPYQISPGVTATFDFTGTYSGTALPLDLMASGCLFAGTCLTDGGQTDANKWAVSAPLGAITTPEPTSMLLFGGAMSIIGMMARRKKALKSK